MPDRFPSGINEKGCDGDRYVGENEKREGENIKNLFYRFCMDMIPFGDRCDQSHDE